MVAVVVEVVEGLVITVARIIVVAAVIESLIEV